MEKLFFPYSNLLLEKRNTVLLVFGMQESGAVFFGLTGVFRSCTCNQTLWKIRLALFELSIQGILIILMIVYCWVTNSVETEGSVKLSYWRNQKEEGV
jgi:hypothetical protein